MKYDFIATKLPFVPRKCTFPGTMEMQSRSMAVFPVKNPKGSTKAAGFDGFAD